MQGKDTHQCGPVIESLDHEADIAGFEREMLSSLGVINSIEYIQSENDKQERCNDCSNSQKFLLTKKEPW